MGNFRGTWSFLLIGNLVSRLKQKGNLFTSYEIVIIIMKNNWEK